MDTFESAINNYRTSTGTIAQGMLQGTIGQLESQQEMSENILIILLMIIQTSKLMWPLI